MYKVRKNRHIAIVQTVQQHAHCNCARSAAAYNCSCRRHPVLSTARTHICKARAKRVGLKGPRTHTGTCKPYANHTRNTRTHARTQYTHAHIHTHTHMLARTHAKHTHTRNTHAHTSARTTARSASFTAASAAAVACMREASAAARVRCRVPACPRTAATSLCSGRSCVTTACSAVVSACDWANCTHHPAAKCKNTTEKLMRKREGVIL